MGSVLESAEEQSQDKGDSPGEERKVKGETRAAHRKSSSAAVSLEGTRSEDPVTAEKGSDLVLETHRSSRLQAK